MVNEMCNLKFFMIEFTSSEEKKKENWSYDCSEQQWKKRICFIKNMNSEKCKKSRHDFFYLLCLTTHVMWSKDLP